MYKHGIKVWTNILGFSVQLSARASVGSIAIAAPLMTDSLETMVVEEVEQELGEAHESIRPCRSQSFTGSQWTPGWALA